MTGNKNRFQRRLRTHFFVPGPIFSGFWAPGRTPKSPKNRPRATGHLFSDHTFLIFLRCLRSGVFRKGPGAILEAPGTLPDQILIRFFIKLYDFSDQIPVGFCDTFLTVASGSCRGLSGFAGVSPGSTSNLSNPLCGVPLGYGDLAQRFKFAVPHRGAGVVLNDCFKSAGPGRVSLPYLPGGLRKTADPFRPNPTDLLFFGFFRFFSHAKKRRKNGTSKIHFFRHFWRFWVAPASLFSHFWSQNRSPEATFSVFF